MIAIDTNVVVRFVTNDDPAQSPRARAFVSENEILLSSTVLLEAEWVLRSVYDMDPTVIAAAFRKVLGLPTVTPEEPDRLARAIEWFETGRDFADALHLAASEGCESFATFDRSLAKAAPDGWTIRVI